MFKVLENIAQNVLIMNDKREIKYVNSQLEGLFGYNTYELVGKSVITLIPENYVDAHDEHVRNYLENATSFIPTRVLELNGIHKSGVKFPLELSLSFFEYESEILSMAIVSDVSEQKRIVDELKYNKLFYSSLVENTTDHIFQIDKSMKVLYINQVSPGLTKEMVLGKSLLNLLPGEEEKEKVKNILDKVLKTGEPEVYETDFPSPVGLLHYSTTVSPVIKDDKVIGANLISRDFTEELNLRNKLIEQQKFIEKVNEYSINGIYIYDFESGKNTYINKAYTTILGYTLEDINEMSEEEFYNCFHDEDKGNLSEHMEDIARLRVDEISELVYRFRSKDGQWKWCKSVDSGFEFNDDGKVASFIGSFIDITKQKESEILLKEKNEEIESFAHTISHDLKSPLNTIIHGLKALQMEGIGKVDERKIQHGIVGTANRMDEMITSLLIRSKIDIAQEEEEFEVAKVIDDLIGDLSRLIEENKAVIMHKNLPVICGVKPLFNALIQNLITNSIKFKDKSRDPRINITSVDRHKHWVFIYEDNGVGIDPKYLTKVFDMFERGKMDSSISGSGIGLANCSKIVSLHGGKIWVESEVGKGCKFYFTVKK